MWLDLWKHQFNTEKPMYRPARKGPGHQARHKILLSKNTVNPSINYCVQFCSCVSKLMNKIFGEEATGMLEWLYEGWMTVTAPWSKCFPPVSVLHLQCQGCSFGLGYSSPDVLFSGKVTFWFVAPLKTAMKKKKKSTIKNSGTKITGQNYLGIFW